MRESQKISLLRESFHMNFNTRHFVHTKDIVRVRRALRRERVEKGVGKRHEVCLRQFGTKCHLLRAPQIKRLDKASSITLGIVRLEYNVTCEYGICTFCLHYEMIFAFKRQTYD